MSSAKNEKLAIHDRICECCVASCGVLHKCGPSYNIETKQWTLVTFELVSCPLWCTDKAVHRWKKRQRRFPFVLTKGQIPPQCVFFLEHFMVEDDVVVLESVRMSEQISNGGSHECLD